MKKYEGEHKKMLNPRTVGTVRERERESYSLVKQALVLVHKNM